MPTKTQIKWNRWTKILSSLNKMDYATLQQLRRLHNLKTYENAYRILRMMEEDDLITCEKRDKKIYYLTQKGKDVVGSETKVPSKRMIEHTVMRNDLYIYLGSPISWKPEAKVKTPLFEFVADAMYIKDKQHHFVEVDREVQMKENRKKVENYTKLNEAYKQQNGKDIVVIFYTKSESRKLQIERILFKTKLKYKIYTVFDIM